MDNESANPKSAKKYLHCNKFFILDYRTSGPETAENNCKKILRCADYSRNMVCQHERMNRIDAGLY
jgi:hypothetical protein